MKLNAQMIIWFAGTFVIFAFVATNMPEDMQRWFMPLVMFLVFVRAAIKMPPIAIAILLFAAMNAGSWLILLAAPGTMLLARRYQRMRQQIDLNPVHIRRTVLLAVVALAGALPFLVSGAGPWSGDGNRPGGRSASPLTGEPGQEGALQRLARWLGFGDGPGGGADPGDLGPRLWPPPSVEPDDPFNWWILVAVIAILALLGLALWLWSRRKPAIVPVAGPAAAWSFARLEAVGSAIGRPRRGHEGAITYSRVLAKETGDARLAEAGPLVSGVVYESAFANPTRTEESLRTIEAAPPPPLPEPTRGEKVERRIRSMGATPMGLVITAVVIAVVIVAFMWLKSKLGDLSADNPLLGLYLPPGYRI